jgi:hypothetical protein
MREKKKELFPESGPNTGFSGNGFTKTVTLHLGSIGPNVQRRERERERARERFIRNYGP